jgi:hypothetical protein
MHRKIFFYYYLGGLQVHTFLEQCKIVCPLQQVLGLDPIQYQRSKKQIN